MENPGVTAGKADLSDFLHAEDIPSELDDILETHRQFLSSLTSRMLQDELGERSVRATITAAFSSLERDLVTAIMAERELSDA